MLYCPVVSAVCAVELLEELELLLFFFFFDLAFDLAFFLVVFFLAFFALCVFLDDWLVDTAACSDVVGRF